MYKYAYTFSWVLKHTLLIVTYFERGSAGNLCRCSRRQSVSMARQQIQPHFLFTIEPIRQSPHWTDRYEGGLWQPPRPRGSNVPVEAGRAFEYNGGIVRGASPPYAGWENFRTYSFYCTEGQIYVYPGDAINRMVGDGWGNMPIPPATRAAPQPDDDNFHWDWRELTFVFPTHEDGSETSQARYRGGSTTIGVLRQQQSHLHDLAQLLPNRYLATQRLASGIQCGGLVGEIPVLIALIAFSVHPRDVDWAMLNCFEQRYVRHGLPRGEGCKFHDC